MSDLSPSWLRRHRRAVAVVTVALLAATGVGFVKLVEKVRREASRAADQ
ncbi:hypothetical protein J0H58_39310 [bacterium]|nr:hypothetical protein [bacterium]